MAGEYYAWRQELWDSVPGVEYIDDDPTYQEAYDLFLNIIEDVQYEHIRPQDSHYWNDFIELFGFANDGDVWDWDAFQEWYNSI